MTFNIQIRYISFFLILAIFCQNISACFERVKINDLDDLTEKCLASKGFDENSTIKKPKGDTFWYDEKLDDKCLNKCLVEKMQLLDENSAVADWNKLNNYFYNRYDYTDRSNIYTKCYEKTYGEDKNCWSPMKDSEYRLIQGEKDVFRNVSIIEIIEEYIPQIVEEMKQIESVKKLSDNVIKIKISKPENDWSGTMYQSNTKEIVKNINGSKFRNISMEIIDGCQFYETIVVSNLPQNLTGFEEALEKAIIEFGSIITDLKDRQFRGIGTFEKIFWFKESKKLPPNLMVEGQEVKLEIIPKPSTISREIRQCQKVSMFLRCFRKMSIKKNICDE